jgi:CheY-like chemotaxis protein
VVIAGCASALSSERFMTTVLIVDDEYLIADILSFALEEEGYLTVTAGNPLKALEIIDRERPDLIITDFMMPSMTGVEFAEAVRLRPGHSQTPMVLMSGAQAHMGVERSDLFIDVLQKPFNIDEVINKVRGIVSPD